METNQGPDAERDLAFFGVVTTSVTHELANVILIIEQVAGLLDDLLASHREGRPVGCERLGVIQERLTRQTRRASALIRNLNHFAHGIDQRSLEFDLSKVVGGLLAVSGRFADSRGITIRAHYPEGEVSLRSDPFAVQQAVFAGLRRAFSICGPGNAIEVTVREEKGEPIVEIAGPSGVDSSTSANQVELLGPLMTQLGGSFALRRKGTHEILTLRMGASGRE